MKYCTRKGISIALVLLLLLVLGSAAVLAAEPSTVEPPAGVSLTMAADKNSITQGDTVTLTTNFNLLSGAISGYNATQVVVLLPAGLDYASSVVYIGGVPAVMTTTPISISAGTSVVVNFDNNAVTAGPAQLRVIADVSSVTAGILTARAELYLQPTGADMPTSPNEQANVILQVVNVTPPVPPTPPEIQVATVTFNLNGGARVGGGALVQAIPIGGTAIEPYVFREGYIFLEWDRSFNNVQQNITVNARWTRSDDTGMIPVEPPIYDFVQGHFINNRNTFMQFSHMPLIYYAERHIVGLVSVEIDGSTLRSGTHYVATTGTSAGTTAIHLKASYLNTLAVGTHTLKVNFRGDVYATTEFSVTRYTNTFNDVSSSDWFYKGVEAMNASELLLGVSNTRFDPYAYMTRGMVVTLLYRYAGEPSVSGFRNPFPDAASGQYYTNAVIWAAANGIVTGHEDGRFAPNDLMTREQFAAVLYRYQNVLGSETMDILMDHQFSDVNQVSSYARSAVNKLDMQGVFRDWPRDSANRFQPQASVTRAEVATVMRLWIESIGW